MAKYSALVGRCSYAMHASGVVVGAIAMILTGCSVAKVPQSPTSSPSVLPRITGKVHGGQQPISGATIQLYATSTSALKGASTPLISTAVITDTNGGFSITGDYTCPSTGALVYIVSTGGNPGLPGTVNNAGITLMSVLGTCGTLAGSTFVSINELTTVAAVEALAPFMVDYAHIGGVTGSSLTIAFQNAVANVNPNTGEFNAVAADGPVPPTALLSTLADILAACVNTSGGAIGDGTPCGTLYQDTTATTGDTVSSLLYIVQNPLSNVTKLFSLAVASSPFQPALSAAPASFAVFIALPGAVTNSHTYDQLFADRQGHVWHYQPAAGLLTQYDTSLNSLHTYNVYNGYSGDGIAGLATLDPSGNLWVPSSPFTVMELGADGSVKSPSGGYSVTTTGLLGALSGIKSDSSGNIWIVVVTQTGAVCAQKYSPSFELLSPQTGYCSSYTYGSSVATSFLTADSSGSVYGFSFGTPPSPVIKFSGSGTVSTFATLSETFFGATSDTKNNRILSLDQTSLSSYKPDGSLEFTITLQGAPNFSLGANFNAVTTDGEGNLWLATEFGRLAAISPAGLSLTACDALYCGIPVDTSAVGSLAGIVVDDAGDIFTVDTTTGALFKYSGLAAPR